MNEKEIEKIIKRLIETGSASKIVIPYGDDVIFLIDKFIDNQPLEWLLYDLNLLPECCLAKIRGGNVIGGMFDYEAL